MNSGDLINYLKENKIWYNLLEKEETIHTKDASEKTGIPLEKLTKSLVVIADKKPFVCIIPGNSKIDFKKLKGNFGFKKTRLCEFKKAHLYSGYEPGGTPPIFYKNIESVIIDKKLMDYNTIFGGGGDRKKLIEIKTKDVVNFNKATVVDISNII